MNSPPIHRSTFIIAAPNSDAGKTTITLGLLRLFKQKGISVQPFKVGPDFIDPKFHYQACGKAGINLDLFMMSEQHIRDQLNSSAHQVRCIEGVMGLFDGARKAERSTAELAIKMNLPVVLVVDAKAVAYSVAPLIKGFRDFNKGLRLLGVIFNRVGSESHYSFLKEACDDVGVKSFGYLQRLDDLHIPSRYLGLNIENIEQFDQTIDLIASKMECTLDWESLLKETAHQSTIPRILPGYPNKKKVRFSIARDEAFNFIYPQHIQAMQALGTVTFFSPIRDHELPHSDFVYFPGGYPECHLKALAANTSMLESVNAYIQNEGKTLAECGGMMYLGKSITDKESNTFAMANVFDFATSMGHARMHLGYRKVALNNLKLKGHEFHYSTIIEQNEAPAQAEVFNAKGMPVNTGIFMKHKVMASYIHYYLGEEKTLMKLIDKIEEL